MVKCCITALVLLTGVIGLPQTARADCTQDLLNCYVAAAKIDNFWYRTVAGIDCEIDFADCVSQQLVAY